MKPGPTFFVILLSLWTTIAYGQAVALSNPEVRLETLLKYKSSLHYMVMNSQAEHLGKQCAQPVKEFLQKGGRFFTTEFDKYLIPLTEFPVAEARDLEFFHYTNAAVVRDLVSKNNYEEIFSYLRSVNMNYLYIAADSQSSKIFGSIQIKLKFSPHTLVVVPFLEDPHYIHVPTMIHIKFKKDLNLHTCPDNFLEILFYEARGVGMIAYFGINDGLPLSDSRGKQWMRVVGSSLIENMSVGGLQ